MPSEPPTKETNMAEQPTCGQGLAENSTLIAKLGAMTDAMADNLEVHLRALDPGDESARREHAIYRRLAEEQRRAAAGLAAIAREMAAARDLPMGRHDMRAMTSPAVGQAFQGFVTAERDLLALLQRRLEGDLRMLAQMGAPGFDGR
jgi:hypothetical protein